MQLENVLVLGSNGMVGRAICRRLEEIGVGHYIDERQYDLTEAEDVHDLFMLARPKNVFLAAAKVGGIRANIKQPADFIHDNLLIQANVISKCRAWGAKLCFLGSSCIYPKETSQPMKEVQLMTGHLEPTNSAYATAKLAGIEMCLAYGAQYGLKYVVLLPTNLYGPYDKFTDPENSHVIPGLMHRMHTAMNAGDKVFEVWGSGLAQREFMHVDDFANAAVYLMANNEGTYNVGTGDEIAVLALANTLKQIMGYTGSVERQWRSVSFEDGMMRKRLDLTRLERSGWTLPKRGLYNGLKQTYEWYLENVVARTA